MNEQITNFWLEISKLPSSEKKGKFGKAVNVSLLKVDITVNDVGRHCSHQWFTD